MSVQIRLGNIEGALQLLKDFLETVPYCDNTHYGGHYQQMFYIIFALLSNYSIIVEPHTAKGRLDVMMETRETIYVMEMKFDKSADEALQQINDRKYADSFAHRGNQFPFFHYPLCISMMKSSAM